MEHGHDDELDQGLSNGSEAHHDEGDDDGDVLREKESSDELLPVRNKKKGHEVASGRYVFTLRGSSMQRQRQSAARDDNQEVGVVHMRS